jgi:hypothetical protein
MDSGLLFDIVTTVTVVAGVIFAALEIRHMGRQRDHANMLALMSSFTSPDFNQALVLIFDMPNGLNKEEVEEYLGDDARKIFTVLTTLESFGVLLHRGEVTIDILDDFFSGPIVLTWQKLGSYVIGLREENHRDTIGEWVQWLAEQMMLRETDGPVVGAHIEFRDWRPPK